jgi:hypothetical protein
MRNGRLSWAEYRPILEQLTGELHESCLDNSLPQFLSPEQAWLSPKGHLQLIETSYAAACNPQTCPDAIDDQRQAIALLAEAAALVLEGKPRPRGFPAREIEAPIPLHARKILDGLLPRAGSLRDEPRYQQVSEFQADLKATEQRPMEVSPWLRAKHLMAHGAYALFCLAPIAVMLKSASTPATWQSVAAVFIGAAVLLAPAFLVRGGISYYVAGIAIVLENGRRASRLRCLARAVVAWGVVAILGLFAWVGVSYLSFVPWSNWTVPALALALLCGYAYLMLHSPSRALHDHALGTCLVPK